MPLFVITESVIIMVAKASEQDGTASVALFAVVTLGQATQVRIRLRPKLLVPDAYTGR
jgi:hypothetical protein